MVKFLKEKTDLTRISSVLSLFTLVAFHWPFFRLVLGNIEGGFNGVLITGGLGVLMFALNFLVYYLVLFLGRFVGKCILAFTFIGNAISLYFINTYQVLITDKMMGNVFNTRYSEASGFFSWSAVWYLLFLGVVPCIYIFARRFDYGSWKRFFARTGIALAVSLAIALVNMQSWPWIDRNAPKLGSLVMPWSYTVNSVRYYNSVKKQNRKEIPLPNAKIVSDSKDVCVLIIGESARRENFSLYGYGKPTNPLLEKDSVTALIADAAATYTTAGVKAILDHKPSNKLYEILPNYLNRSGVDVVWRSNNWGEPPVHIDKYYKPKELKERNPEADDRYDGILLAGLREEILSGSKDKMLFVLHTSTSHGPTYYKKYPPEFEVFSPVCTTVEMSKADPKELMNAYDNTIVYTEDSLRGKGGIPPVSPENRAAMEYFMAQGGTFCVSTGRALPSFAALKDGIPMNGPTVLFNGAAIYDFAAGRYLCTAFLPERIRDHVRQLTAEMPDLTFEIYHDDNSIHVVHPNEITARHLHLTHSPSVELDSLDQAPSPIAKLLFEEEPPRLRQLEKYIREQPWSREYEIVASASTLLEITAKGANKGGMVRRLAQLLHIRQENVCCVGDHANDIPMLEFAGMPFAPANAIESVRRVPGVQVLPDCRENAIAAMIAVLDQHYQ